MTDSRRDIEVRIDRLVLPPGAPVDDAAHAVLAAAIEAHVASALGHPRRSGAGATTPLGDAVGAGVAAAVAEALGSSGGGR